MSRKRNNAGGTGSRKMCHEEHMCRGAAVATSHRAVSVGGEGAAKRNPTEDAMIQRPQVCRGEHERCSASSPRGGAASLGHHSEWMLRLRLIGSAPSPRSPTPMACIPPGKLVLWSFSFSISFPMVMYSWGSTPDG